jgi:uncharacterized protein (UPF0303 family)
MTDPGLEPIARDIEKIAQQEQVLRFATFDESAAWRLGAALRERAEASTAPVVIDIRSHERLLFCSALSGSSPDNWEWVRRKSNLVHRFYRSSYRFGLELRAKGATLTNDSGLDLLDYAPHGGSFPINVVSGGFIGAITVSGLPQREDHNLVVAALCAFLGKDPRELALAPPP